MPDSQAWVETEFAAIVATVWLSGGCEGAEVVTEPGIQDDDELAHASDDGDLEGLAFGLKSQEGGFDGGEAADGGESSHVEGVADAYAAAADAAAPAQASAVMVEGGDAAEGSDLVAIEIAELGHGGEEDGSGQQADAMGAAQQSGARGEVRIGPHELDQAAIEREALLVQGGKPPPDPGAQGGIAGVLELVGERGVEVDNQAPIVEGLRELASSRAGRNAFGRGHVGGEVGEHLGIEAIGLGPPAERAGVVADMSGVDEVDMQARVLQDVDQGRLIAARGFDDDAHAIELAQALDQRLMAGAIVGDMPSVTAGQDIDIEAVFGDVDADRTDSWGHSGIPSLQLRALGAGNRSGVGITGELGTTLRHARLAQGAGRSPPRRAGLPATRSRAPLLYSILDRQGAGPRPARPAE